MFHTELSLHPLHLKQLVFQALMKRIPQETLESFLFEKYNHINNLQNQDTSKTPIESHHYEKCDANCDARVQKSAPGMTGGDASRTVTSRLGIIHVFL